MPLALLLAVTALIFPSVGATQSVPLPERNPLRIAPVLPVPPPLHPRERKADEWSAQEIQIAQDACAMMLDDSSTVYEPVPAIREGVCGTPSPILLRSIGKGTPVAIEPPAKVTCGLAASLDAWSESVLQTAAEKHLGSSVISIRNVASYVCRNRYNMPDKRISQHALANALDMASFILADGQKVSVLEHWHETESVTPPTDSGTAELAKAAAQTGKPTAQPSGAIELQQTESETEPVKESTPSARSLFLQEIHAGGCTLFGTVLGPLANEAHKDHFHFDLAERNHGNFCE